MILILTVIMSNELLAMIESLQEILIAFGIKS